MDAGHILREISYMDEKTKDIAIVSLEEWEQFINQLLEEPCAMMANIILSVSDPKMADILGDASALVFGKTAGAISKKLFPDAELIKNEKGEIQWK